MALDARPGQVAGAAAFGIEGSGRPMAAQTPQACVALGQHGAMAAVARRCSVAAVARPPLCAQLVFVEGQARVLS